MMSASYRKASGKEFPLLNSRSKQNTEAKTKLKRSADMSLEDIPSPGFFLQFPLFLHYTSCLSFCIRRCSESYDVLLDFFPKDSDSPALGKRHVVWKESVCFCSHFKSEEVSLEASE